MLQTAVKVETYITLLDTLDPPITDDGDSGNYVIQMQCPI